MRPNYEGGQNSSMRPNYEGGQNSSMRPNYEAGQNSSMRPNYEGGQNSSMRPNYEGGQNSSMRPNYDGGQVSGFLHPNMTNQQSNQQSFNNGFPPMQFSQTAHYVPPCSSRSDSYWHSMLPHGQLPQYSYPPHAYYSGMSGEFGNEMRYLRE
jgi:hypothetical protein